MNILEALKKPLFSKPNKEELSSEPSYDNIDAYIEETIPTGFFDNQPNIGYQLNGKTKESIATEQSNLIRNYRKLANQPEVANAVSIIVDEAIFSPGSDEIIELDFKGEISDSLKKKIIKELKNITIQMNLDKHIYSLFQRFYIDGQLNIHTPYLDKNLKKGIKEIKVLNPINLGFNRTTDKWEYVENSHQFSDPHQGKGDIVFDREEVIRIDSGIYSDNLILSNLNGSIVAANILKSLEDSLVPIRFTRSVSRRVFNVDLGRLNGAKAKEAMNKIQEKFKYKKYYDFETGEVKNQQHITSLVEDYWFPMENGNRGMNVDTIDEKGSLGELDDILYVKSKLYTSLNIPSSRVSGDTSPDFDFTGTSVTREELKFFNFISRLRNQFLELFYELLKRNVVAKGICSEKEWNIIVRDTKIKFTSENKFFEKMKRDNLQESINTFRDIEEMAGKYFSYEFVFKDVLGMSDDAIEKLQEQIKKEKENPFYKRFYENGGDGEWK